MLQQMERRAVVPPAAAPSGAVAAASRLIAALSRCLDAETAMLAENGRDDLGRFNAEKSRLLMEYSQIGQQIGEREMASMDRHLVSGLADAIERNRRQLEVSIYVNRQMTDTLIEMARDVDCDRTYSRDMAYGR